MNWVLFSLYSLSIFSVVCMILCVNPIHSVLCFIFLFFRASSVSTLLHSDSIGLIFPMVYVGAIAVLSIFVVMMLNIKRIERDNTTYPLIGGFISILFTVQLFHLFLNSYTIHSPSNTVFYSSFAYDYLTNNDEFVKKYLVQLIGVSIFYHHSIISIFSGVTLPIALIGSVYPTNFKTGYSLRRQDNQFNRNAAVYNIHIY
jgi:NADH:ubiquinone oxidoreductase subunit 6 (subunit J)